jgi:hypothetical protein
MPRRLGQNRTPNPTPPMLNPLFLSGAALAVVLGFAIRAALVFETDFPLNDGGLFLAMVEAVRENNLAVPRNVYYNGLEIPFAYPPLSFTVAAFLADLGMRPLDTLRFVPLLVNTLAIVAMACLARLSLPTALGAAAATIIFAVLPGSFVWQIMGGGLTRSFGFLFAVLGIGQAYQLAVRGPSRARVLLLALCATLTALSHLEMAWFFTLGTGCVLLAFGRRWDRLLSAALAALIAAAAASPWWMMIITRHGLEPFLAASRTGSIVGNSPADTLKDPALLFVIGVLIFVIAVGGRLFFVLGALGVLLLFESRSFSSLSVPILAIALGGFVGEVANWTNARLAASPQRTDTTRLHPIRVIGSLAVVFMTVLTTLWFNGGVLVGLGLPTAVLAGEERAAMGWVQANTEPIARFLVISGDPWSQDRSSEWFPVLAQRVSVATVQGAEWLPGGEFLRRAEQHSAVQACGTQSGTCLEQWVRESGRPFDYVYIASRTASHCCAALRAALEQDPRYARVFANAGATVFRPTSTSSGS